MRSLKFRAWTHQKSPMQWSQKAVAITGEGEQILPVGGTFTGVWHAFDTDDGGLFIEQYTGLKDKNGREIYEGDIVKMICRVAKDESTLYKVVWDDFLTRYDLINLERSKADVGYLTKYNIEEHFEVIGNIHENPELL